MKVQVEMRGEVRELEMNEDFTGKELLKKLNFSFEEVIIIVENKPVPYTEKIIGKKIKIVRVASGG